MQPSPLESAVAAHADRPAVDSSFRVHAIFPNYYDGTRVSYSLKSILAAMKSPAVQTHTYVLGKAKHVAGDVSALLPMALYTHTSRLIRKPSEAIVSRFGHLMHAGDVAYFWMTNPPQLTRTLQKKGLLVVREMINCTLARRRAELARAYALLDQPDISGITQADIEQERAELLAADAVFCPNEFVLESVLAYGVPRERCIRTSYGWTPERINGHSRYLPKGPGVDMLFVGSADVRKGFPWLLKAWVQAGINGRLLIAGTIDPAISTELASILSRPDIVQLGYVNDVGAVYRSADAFCFPTWEEGGPMVTIEAMGAGLACIVTPMGGSGILSAESGGAIIVKPGDVNSIAAAITRLGTDDLERTQLGRRAHEIAVDYTWALVGQRRGEAIIQLRKQWMSA